MRLFSEKVTPTFTSSNQNILTIKDFNEVFFDVYELEINGNKYIAEKVSEYKGNPVVNIPIVNEGRELEAPFVIQRGNFEVIFNESNSTFIKVASDKPEEVFIEQKSRDTEVEEIIFEKKESILEEINQARQAATKYADSIQQKNLRHLEERSNRNQEVFTETATNFKKVLLEEFLNIAEDTREELFTYNQLENKKTYEYITTTVSQLAEKLNHDLSEEVASQHESTIKIFEKNISSLAKNILTDKLLKKIAANNSENIKTVDIKFETVSKTLAKVLGDYEVQLDEKIKKALDSYESHIITLEQSNIELNDSIVKSTNKALSRIGNVKTQLEESIDSISSELVDKITLAESKIKEYYNERITLIENNVVEITTKDKAFIIELIEESKQSILKEVDIIKSNVPSIVVEKTLETKGDVDIKKIKTDLEKSISNRFTQELANVRRVIELSSGGGSVAQQFANGGTMNGSLTVVGTISASQYLGIPVYTDTDTLSTVTGRGNTTTDSITVGGMTVLGGLTADRIYTTQLEALSANITVLDIKQYELSGFNVQGDCTIQGNVSASGTITADNMILSGNQVATVVDPVRTTLTGNGVLSAFAISGADGLVNPSALIVAIDGALQEPVVDYTVASGNITFTSPLADGSKAVVISPSHTLQVSQMIPADGSVTSEKLDTDISIAGQLTVTGQPALSALSSNHVLTYGLAEDQYAWIDLPAAFANFSSLGGSTSVSVIGASIDTGASTASFSTARTRFAGFFNRSPLAWVGGNAQFIPFASCRTRIRAIINTVTLLGNAYFWFGVWDKNSLISTTDEFDAKGFGVKLTPTTLIAQTHDGTTLFQSSPSSLVLNNTVLLEIDYYQQNLLVKVDGAVIATVSGGYNIDNSAQIHFYGYAPNGGSAGDNARAELKQLRYLITEN